FPQQLPSPDRVAAAYDPNTEQMVVTLCEDDPANPSTVRPVTWVWQKNRWEDVGATFPCSGTLERIGHAMVYDEANSEILLFGGQLAAGQCPDGGQYCADLYAFTGTSWVPRCGVGTGAACTSGPSGRAGARMTYSSVDGAVLLVGGGGPNCDGSGVFNCDTTWRWSGTSWSQRCGTGSGCASPLAGNRIVLADVPTASHVLAYDEESYYTWDGAAWTERCAGGSCRPSPVDELSGPALGTLTDSGTAILYGGGGADFLTNNTVWEWLGSSWVARDTVAATRFGVRSGIEEPFLFGAGTQGGAILFGGDPPFAMSSFVDDVWTWERNADGRPAHVFRASFGAALPAPGFSIEDIVVTWDSAASGPDGDGAGLFVWDQRGWRPLLTNAIAAGTAVDGSWRLRWRSSQDAGLTGASADQIARRFFIDAPRFITTAVAPLSRNGSDGATVETDYVEVRVLYRQ
ncbi:MAG: hypothetical protein AAF658_07280, partial [Myxococcota bacterium]